MMHKLTFRAMLLGGVCMAPLGAMAADLGGRSGGARARSDDLGQRDRSRARRSLGDEHRPVRPLQRLHRGGARRAVRFQFDDARRVDRRHALLHLHRLGHQLPVRRQPGTAPYPCTTPPPPSGSARPAASRTTNIRAQQPTTWGRTPRRSSTSAIRDIGG